jgi:hypothetical protein
VDAFTINDEEEMARKDNSIAMILNAGAREDLGAMEDQKGRITKAHR